MKAIAVQRADTGERIGFCCGACGAIYAKDDGSFAERCCACSTCGAKIGRGLCMPCREKAGGLTARQAEVLAFLRAFIAERGFPPTYREMGLHFGWASSNAAGDFLRVLERKGHIIVDRFGSRAIRIVGDPPPLEHGPRCGSIAAVQEPTSAQPAKLVWLGFVCRAGDVLRLEHERKAS